MAENLILKIEIVETNRQKIELVRIHNRDHSIDFVRPIDLSIQAALGKNFKGYFMAQVHGTEVVVQNETTWTEWNKGRLS